MLCLIDVPLAVLCIQENEREVIGVIQSLFVVLLSEQYKREGSVVTR